MKNGKFVCRLKRELSELCRVRAVLVFGGLIAVVAGLLMLLLMGRGRGWYAYRLPPILVSRTFVVLDGALWNFICGGAVAAACSTRLLGREAAGKCLLDIAVAMVFFGLWLPLTFSAAAPLLGLLSLIGSALFFVFAFICSLRENIILTAVMAAAVIHQLYCIWGAVAYMVLNCILI